MENPIITTDKGEITHSEIPYRIRSDSEDKEPMEFLTLRSNSNIENQVVEDIVIGDDSEDGEPAELESPKSDSENEESLEIVQLVVTSMSYDPQVIQNFTSTVSLPEVSVVAELKVYVIRALNHEGKPIIFYKALPFKNSELSLPMNNVDQIELAQPYIVKDPRITHLLRKVGLNIDKDGSLPHPSSILERLWAPSEIRGDSNILRAKATKCLGYRGPALSKISNINYLVSTLHHDVVHLTRAK